MGNFIIKKFMCYVVQLQTAIKVFKRKDGQSNINLMKWLVLKLKGFVHALHINLKYALFRFKKNVYNENITTQILTKPLCLFIKKHHIPHKKTNPRSTLFIGRWRYYSIDHKNLVYSLRLFINAIKIL